MTNLDYANIETPTGDWSGSASLPPTHYGEYKAIYSSVTGVEKPNGIITFDNLPANLKIVSGSTLNLPFDRVYVDIDGYSDYVLMYSTGAGNYVESGINGFMAAYTSGGFWLLGDNDTDSPGVILMAQGSAPTSAADILSLDWTTIASPSFSQMTEPELGSYFDMASSSAIVFTPYMPYLFSGFYFNKNEYDWQKKIFYPILDEGYSFSYFTSSGFGGLFVTGLDSTNSPKSFLFTYEDLVPEAEALAFWWDGDELTGQIFTDISSASIDTPAPFNGIIIPSTYAEYVDATVYPDEPMISYSVIDDHTIQITSDIDSVISPLKKLYINFSGIS